MYHDFYNFHTLPFENTPDPRFFFASEQHREALAAVEYSIRMRKGFVLITGAIGSGKTTVGRIMCQRCGSDAPIIHVGWGHQERDGLIRQILRHLGAPLRRSDDHAGMLDQLRQVLLQKLQQNQPIILFVDEAQTLSDDALEELRLLSNFDTSTDKLLQIVLVGQPELRDRLRTPRHAALRQRIVLAKQIQPLSLTDTHAYIEHRLQAASQNPHHPGVVFDAQAVHEIYGITAGTPRLINVVCDNCLLLGYVRECRLITPSIVRRVVQDMVPNFEAEVVVDPAVNHPPMRLAGNF
ncbi:MAG: AAA family ATPase [Phycisphaeraceae bacterium]|nr:AAA family ATPase [Phycisphaeraceae bacterium]